MVLLGRIETPEEISADMPPAFPASRIKLSIIFGVYILSCLVLIKGGILWVCTILASTTIILAMLWIGFYWRPYKILQKAFKDGCEVAFHYWLTHHPLQSKKQKQETVKKPGTHDYRIPLLWFNAKKIVIKKSEVAAKN